MNKLQKIAEETIAAIDAEKYKAPSGANVLLSREIGPAVRRSKLYRPNEKEEINKALEMTRALNANPEIVVTRESTLGAAARLANERPCLLNFASAKHPGGGFLRGANAQEESIARSSALYPTLIKHPEFYEENKRSQRDNVGLYLDYAIYSPDVPVFRNDAGDWLEQSYLTSVLTSPAPNRHAIFSDEDNKMDDDQEEAMEIKIEETLSRRMYQVLSIMALHGHRTIILGAWGCGVFGNDPLLVAELFKENLKKLPFFDRVAFPIYDRSDSDTLRSFVSIFGQEYLDESTTPK